MHRQVYGPPLRFSRPARWTHPHPSDLAVIMTHFLQRASFGLVISEATHMCEQGVGWCDVPGIYTEEQAQGWKVRRVVGLRWPTGGWLTSKRSPLLACGRSSP